VGVQAGQQSGELMKKASLINLGLALLVFAAICLVSWSRMIGGVVETLISIGILTAVIGLSIYKLALWFRYRHDPERREQIVYSGANFPRQLRRFFMDEKHDDNKK